MYPPQAQPRAKKCYSYTGFEPAAANDVWIPRSSSSIIKSPSEADTIIPPSQSQDVGPTESVESMLKKLIITNEDDDEVFSND